MMSFICFITLHLAPFPLSPSRKENDTIYRLQELCYQIASEISVVLSE